MKDLGRKWVLGPFLDQWFSGMTPIGRAGSPLPAARTQAKDGAHGVTRPTAHLQMTVRQSRHANYQGDGGRFTLSVGRRPQWGSLSGQSGCNQIGIMHLKKRRSKKSVNRKKPVNHLRAIASGRARHHATRESVAAQSIAARVLPAIYRSVLKVAVLDLIRKSPAPLSTSECSWAVEAGRVNQWPTACTSRRTLRQLLTTVRYRMEAKSSGHYHEISLPTNEIFPQPHSIQLASNS